MQEYAEHQARRMGAKRCYAYADVCYAHADVCYAYADVCRSMRSTKRVRRYVGPMTMRSEIRAKFIQDPQIGGGGAEGHLSIVP